LTCIKVEDRQAGDPSRHSSVGLQMSIRTILVAASGGTATAGAVQLACQLARRFSAHIEGYHVVLDPTAALAVTGDGFGVPAPVALIESMLDDAKAKAAETLAIFEEIAKQYEIPRRGPPQFAAPRPSFGWLQEAGDAPTLVARRGRFFDLIVLGRSDRVIDEPHSDTVEEVLMRSGRPVLLAPASSPSQIGNVIAVAWNGSAQAARALAAGMPFLEKAEAVWLITAGDPERLGAPQVIQHLAWHGIDARHRSLPGTSARQIGEKLIDAARQARADMLIMGGYGHAPWRELLFGGATREAVATMPMPLLLVH
jgi:nucleotide-binding universal stress UspA family protein